MGDALRVPDEQAKAIVHIADVRKARGWTGTDAWEADAIREALGTGQRDQRRIWRCNADGKLYTEVRRGHLCIGECINGGPGFTPAQAAEFGRFLIEWAETH